MATERLPVIILCGGQGVRMQSPTNKVLTDIGGRPILWHVMRIYAAFGHTRFILALGHQAEDIKRYFLEYNLLRCDMTLRLGRPDSVVYHCAEHEAEWEITLVDTGTNVEKGTRIRCAARYVDTQTFAVAYGEALGNIDLDALLAFHRRHGRLATVTGVRLQSHLGIFELDESGEVSGFREKPELDHWVNAGFMFFERGVLDYMDGEDVHLEREVLPRLVADRQLMMYRHTGFWRSMKTFKDALDLETVWHESQPWKVWE